MKISQLLSGVILFLGGLIMIIFSFFSDAKVVLLIYGIPIFLIGIAILLNKKEDKIEQIKKPKGGKK